MKPFREQVGNKWIYNFHPGQIELWDCEANIILVCAGYQSGKTVSGPCWVQREIERTYDPNDPFNDHLVATATNDLFQMKLLPVLLDHFTGATAWGFYRPSERTIYRKDGRVRIILRSAQSDYALESATAKSAWLDECGHPQFQREAYEGALRRVSVNRGRLLLTTTPYNLGWLKVDVYDRAIGGDPDYAFINFRSCDNPAFSMEAYEAGRRRFPDWKFQMFYNGVFTKPAGLIYSDFDDTYANFTPLNVGGDMMAGPGVYTSGGNLVGSFRIPTDWPRTLGVDPGEQNPGRLWVALDPSTGNMFGYREKLGGGLTAVECAREVLEYREPIECAYGGSSSEQDSRLAWNTVDGIDLAEPLIKEVEAGIDHVIALFKTHRFFVFDTLNGVRSELGTYSRELDGAGEPTHKIQDKQSYHLCFVGGTLITLERGQTPIENVKIGDMALTRDGYKPVIAAGSTGLQDVVTLETSDGRHLTGTPNHPIFVHGKGFVPLDKLRYGDTIEASHVSEGNQWNERLLSSEGSGITGTLIPGTVPTGTTLRTRVGICIGRYTNAPMVQYRRVRLFTIRMITSLITYPRTWRLCRVETTLDTTWEEFVQRRTVLTWLLSGIKRRHGTPLKRVCGGTQKMRWRCGSLVSHFARFATSAVKGSMILPGVTPTGSVPISVSPSPVGSPASMMRHEPVLGVANRSWSTSILGYDTAPVHVVGVHDAAKSEVYNLTVADKPEFYAEGIMVHNCDTVRYACSGFPLVWDGKPPEKVELAAPRTVEGITARFGRDREPVLEGYTV